MKGVFVTGTDTDVGKTVVSALLCLRWGASYWKPIQCGIEPATDRETVSRWIGDDKIVPESFVLQNPLSPNQAAVLENVEIDISRFQVSPVSPVVAEGAGGILVPINRHQTMLDLAIQLQLPVVIVARSGLGTLNHTFLTLQALRARKVPVLGVVMVGEPHPLNRKSIEEIGEIRVLLELPKVREINRAWLMQMADLLPSLEDIEWN